jgi:endoglucanase
MSHSTGGPTTGGWNVWSTGYISTNHIFTAGSTMLKVTASGTEAAGVWPQMTLAVGGTLIGSVAVNTTTYKEYSFTYNATAGSKEIRVSFTNDYWAGGEDRNLLVDKVVVGCPGEASEGCNGSTGFAISVPLSLDKTTVQAGQALTGEATYKNCSSAAMSVQQVVIAGRRPGASHSGGPYDDLMPVQGAIVLPAGDTLTITASRDFTRSDPAGQWVSYATYQDADGTWHDGPDVMFIVQTGSGVLPGTYTTGVPFRGINRAGLEYGDEWWGWTGQIYYEIPTASQIASELAYFNSKGFNTIRLPISWERVQHALNGPLTSSYVAGMMAYINAATSAGFYVILDLHNYNRYAENTHNSAGTQVSGYVQRKMGDGVLTISHLVDIWVKLTNLVLANPKVILNLMNESHDFDMTSTEWFAGVQTVMNAIRATGSTHLILVPNSRSSDVEHWDTYAPNGGPLDSVAALAITDTANNYAFDMHAYQNYPTSSTSYSNLVSGVTYWARTNNKKLFLSEMGTVAGAANGSSGIGGLLSYLNSNEDVWLGWTPWDLTIYSLTSGSHTADAPSMSWYQPYLVPNILENSGAAKQ